MVEGKIVSVVLSILLQTKRVKSFDFRFEYLYVPYVQTILIRLHMGSYKLWGLAL